jgi:hypothetical protein
MASCGGKGAILHLSYLPNELVDPVGKFQQILISMQNNY